MTLLSPFHLAASLLRASTLSSTYAVHVRISCVNLVSGLPLPCPFILPQVVSQAQIFLLAGYETTANALAFAVRAVASHPEGGSGTATGTQRCRARAHCPALAACPCGVDTLEKCTA